MRYHALSTTLSKIDPVGRLIIPAQARRALHLENVGPVVLTLVDGELRVRSVATAMASLQAQASSYLAGDGTSVAAFLVARRSEAAPEEEASVGSQDQGGAITMELVRGA